MAECQPSKKDIELVFKKLRAIATNKVCFDCLAKNPTWSSVTYGVFICIDCSAVHRSLGVHVTFVRSTQLDTNWTWLQLRQMQLGGNANAESFFQQHNCNTKDTQQKYNSRAAHLYKEKLLNAASQAMRLHGTKLHLDGDHESFVREDIKEVDFFEEHNKIDPDFEVSTNKPTNGSFPDTSGNINVMIGGRGPLVTLVAEDVADRKPTIGVKKPLNKRSGLGGKKVGGLGAQRVKTNFADIEKEAELADKLKVQEKQTEQKPGEEDDQIASVRLAYEDLSLKQKKEEEKMKAVDPLKARQMERLGMGLGARTGISHSALSDMRTIEQESPVKPSKPPIERDNEDFFDFGFSSNSSSSFIMYKNASESKNVTSVLGETQDGFRNNNKYAWSDYDGKQPSSIDKKTSAQNISTNEAQKKFGSAKAISSEQFFSDSSESQWERKNNLSRFEGSSSISSAEFFGRKENNSNRVGLTPDLEDVRESVKQGVTKVAGKLSSLANGVMTSIQNMFRRLDTIFSFERLPKHVLPEQEAGDDGNRYMQFAILLFS